MAYAKVISDKVLADVADLVAARRPIPAIIVEVILHRLRVAEAGNLVLSREEERSAE